MRDPGSRKNPGAEGIIPSDGKADIDEGHIGGDDIIDVAVGGAELKGLDIVDQDVVRRRGEVNIGPDEFDRSVRARWINLRIPVSDQRIVRQYGNRGAIPQLEAYSVQGHLGLHCRVGIVFDHEITVEKGGQK